MIFGSKHSWLNLYKHIKSEMRIKVVSSCQHYRQLAHQLPTADDTVLEVGCSMGMATQQLVKHAKQVIAVDNSAQYLAEAEQRLAEASNVEFFQVDGRELIDLRDHIDLPDLIFLDIGGNAHLGNVSSMLRLCLLSFTPRMIVVRNFELAILQHLVEDAELPEKDSRVQNALGETLGANLQSILDLSYSTIASDRLFAARKLNAINNPIARERLQQMAEDSNAKIRRISYQNQ